MTTTELQQRILSAHTRGDKRELERLQEVYRRGATVISAGRGALGTMTLGQPGARVSTTPTRAPAVQAPSSIAPRRRTSSADVDPPNRVYMGFDVRRSLRQAAAEWSAGGLESAGFLFGRFEVDCFGTGTRVKILDFSRPRFADERKPAALRFSSAHIDEALSGQLSRWQIVGDWHTHTSDHSTLEPSSVDFQGWGGRADRVSWEAGRPPGYIGIVITAEPGGDWMPQSLRMAAYFVPPMRWDSRASEPKPIEIRVEG